MGSAREVRREAEAAAVALQMRVGERNHSARLLVSPPLPLPEPSENPVEPPSAEELAAQLALALVLGMLMIHFFFLLLLFQSLS